MKVREFDVPDSVRKMTAPLVYLAVALLLFPVGTAYREFTGIFERATDSFEWTAPITIDTVPEDFELRRSARGAVRSVLSEIGNGLTVRSVEVMKLDDSAYYHTREDKVIFSSRVAWNEDTLLGAAGHEATHVLWARLRPRKELDVGYENLINEMTAYVLGAHLAGRVRTREGGNGDALRARLIDDYRLACDDSHPKSARNLAAGKWVFMRGDLADPDFYQHWGSVQMVDEIDAICSRHPRNAVTAAQAIADRYLVKPPQLRTPLETEPSASSQVAW